MAGSSVKKLEKGTGRTRIWNHLALLMWMGGIHVNFFVAGLILTNLRSTWAITLLAVWIALVFIPARSDGPVGQIVAKFICKYAPKYFPITVVFEDEGHLNSDGCYVIAAEPHSVLPVGIIVLTPQSGFLPLTKIRALASTAVFWTPIIRHIWTWLGLVPVSRRHFSKLLEEGYSCILVPGGVQECLYMEPDREVVYLKNRFGFVKVAIQAGAAVVPCFCFGQTNTYRWWKPSGKWYNQMSRKLGFTPLVFWGRFGGPVPFQKPMYFVVGKPIDVTKNPSPTNEEIAVLHGQYIRAVEELFEKHKAAAGFKDTSLYVY
ncbi:unnamed protein product [Sphagnum troendelagicum]|uniref:Acyltransferase n=1 Tax=Sphagnum troendelagicum TaxID=128251 RepID=A0ABP0TQT5_9BRYO